MRKIRLLPVVSVLSFFLGFESAGYQYAVLSMSEEFRLTSAGMGLLIAVQYTAIMAAPLLFGNLADRLGKRTVLAFAAPVFICGCALAALAQSAVVFAIGIFLVGAGFGVCECVSGAALIDRDPTNGDRQMNLTQFLFSLGAVVSPLLTQQLMRAGLSWRTPFWLCAVAYIIIYPFLLKADFAPFVPQQAVHGENIFRLAGGTRGVLPLLAALLAYVGVETGVVYFADALFTKSLDAAMLAPYAISSYWLAMGLSRLLFSVLHYRAERVVAIGQGVLCVAMLAIAFSRTPVLTLICFVLAGAASGPTWPLIFTMTARRMPAHSGAASSLISVCSGAGGAGAPALMGVLALRAGLSGSYLLLGALCAVGFACLLTICRERERMSSME